MEVRVERVNNAETVPRLARVAVQGTSGGSGQVSLIAAVGAERQARQETEALFAEVKARVLARHGRTPGTPWDRPELPRILALWRTVALASARPRAFFGRLGDARLGGALSFVAVLLPPVVLVQVWSITAYLGWGATEARLRLVGWVLLALLALGSYLFGFYHLGATVFARRPVRRIGTARVLCYGLAPWFWGLVPGLGLLVVPWSLLLHMLGLQQMGGLKTWQAPLVVLAPLVPAVVAFWMR